MVSSVERIWAGSGVIFQILALDCPLGYEALGKTMTCTYLSKISVGEMENGKGMDMNDIYFIEGSFLVLVIIIVIMILEVW